MSKWVNNIFGEKKMNEQTIDKCIENNGILRKSFKDKLGLFYCAGKIFELDQETCMAKDFIEEHEKLCPYMVTSKYIVLVENNNEPKSKECAPLCNYRRK